jgi:hypothetical protein
MSGALKPAVPIAGDLGRLAKIVGSGHVSCRVAFIPTIVQLRLALIHRNGPERFGRLQTCFGMLHIDFPLLERGEEGQSRRR